MFFAKYQEILIAKENRGALEKALIDGSVRFSLFINRSISIQG